MKAITAAMVKELREQTGAGMMECKKALVEAEGDMAKAEDILAKSGQRKAAKSASRTAAEGRIAIAKQAQGVAILEVNCETDFVGRDDSFIAFCQMAANTALEANVKDIKSLSEATAEGETIEEHRKKLIARLGENIQLRRVSCLQVTDKERVGMYVHLNRIGSVVLLEGGNDELAKDLAMQVASMRPRYVSPDEVPEAVVNKEKEILMELAKKSGKPENILEKILSGQINKFLNEICLTGQAYFKDPDQTISSLLKTAQATVHKMVRFEVGEGIEVSKKSFEEEVMSAAKGN